MEAHEIFPETTLALEVGKVAGAVKVLTDEVAGMRGEVNEVHTQLAQGSERMLKIEGTLDQMVELQKIANGRTTKNEDASRGLRRRIEAVEAKWETITFVPRMLDKLAEHKVLGLVLTVPLTSALSILIYNALA